jgi:CBS domain-containing protein
MLPTDAPEGPQNTGHPGLSPSAGLLEPLVQELCRHPPFDGMAPADVRAFVEAARQAYFAPGEALVKPGDGPARELFFIRRGAVVGQRGLSDVAGGAFAYEAGDLFPVSAVLAQRATTTAYHATEDTFVLRVPAAQMRALAERSPVFSDFLNRRVLRFLDLSRAALQSAYASRVLAEQSMETPLERLCRQEPVHCAPDTPLREALERMHRLRIGSMLVADPEQRPVGILTRYDVLDRVALSGVPLDTPMSAVMVAPVHCLASDRTAQDAALLMSSQGIRHVPVTRHGRLVGMVSERDLYALQRMSLNQVSERIRRAPDLVTLQAASEDIRRFARHLLGQGVQALQLTQMISHLNDVLTERLVQLKVAEHGLDLQRFCWIALGSEGRGEQTIATDQDNALILGDDVGADERHALLRMAGEVNQALDACGYPLCKGRIMAGNPDCCLGLSQWQQRFAQWIEQGSPQDLLHASIYFDFRPLAGQPGLAATLRESVVQRASGNPRFVRQLAVNGLVQAPPLNWRGQIDTTPVDGHDTLDLKLQGTAILVDVARLYALAHGIAATSTRERLEGAGPRLGVPAREHGAWVTGFEFLQMLRLRAQLDSTTIGDNPNRIAVDALNDIDRRILREALRMVRSLQQRVQLDYQR